MTEKTNKLKKKHKKPAKKSKVGNSLHNVFNGEFLTKKKSVRLLPFLLFITSLAVFYIGNTYYGEKMIRKIQSKQKKVNELRFEYITTKSDLLELTKQSSLADKLKSKGIKESTTPPYKIFIKKK
jgi:hypothetical protein